MRWASRWLAMLCLYGMATWVHAAVAPVPVCTSDAVSLVPWAWIADDPDGRLTPDDVMRLPSARLQPAASAPALGYGDTWWLRIDLRNDAATPCRRWLLVGPARLRDVRLYVRHGDDWSGMRSGSDYPLRDWASPARRPVFPLTLEPGTTTVLVHVVDRGGPVAFTPELWNNDQFRRSEVRQALSDGVVGGSMLVLVMASLVLGLVYRRPLLFSMALAALFYTLYVGVLDNYAFVYLWPDSPRLNLWVRYLCINLTYAAAFRYFSSVMRVHRLGPVWSRLFAIAQCGFVALALVGGLASDSAAVTSAMLGLDQLCRLLLIVAAVVGLLRRTMHSWYTPVLVVWLVGQDILLYGHVLGGAKSPSAANVMYVATVLGGGALLLGTLISEVRKSRRRELRVRAELDRQAASERERLERTVALRTADLDRALQARRLLLARISHDLRSPLAAIVDNARQWQAGGHRHDHARLIERNAAQQMELIDELLEFSREELAELELVSAPGYLHAFLHDVAEQAQLMAERNGNRMQAWLAPSLPPLVSADFRRLRQVLMNLLGNAAKFTRAGLVTLRVERLGDTAGDLVRLRFTVQDDGIGIVPEERDRLLQPFVRGGNAADRQGSGLGLAIVSQLLGHMDSHLDMDTPAEGGSRFRFELELPLADEEELEPGFRDTGAGIDGDGRRILVVEDQAQQREAVRDLLDSHGFDSITAGSGVEALALLRGQSVDLVLTDQAMPEMDGWALLAAVREHHPHLPVVLYSAVPPRRPAGAAADLGFDASLLKSTDTAELWRCLRRLLRLDPDGDAVASRSELKRSRFGQRKTS